jgi:hypothetical protein
MLISGVLGLAGSIQRIGGGWSQSFRARFDHSFVYRSSRLISKFIASATGRIAFFGAFIDVLRFVLLFWFRSLGIFRSLPSDKLVSQTSRLGIRPALRQTTPLHSIQTPEGFRNAGSRGCFWFAPFAALVWPGSSLSFGSITLSLRHRRAFA